MTSDDSTSKEIIDLNKIEFSNIKIGRGGFATVYKVINKDTKEIYAAKVLKINISEASSDEKLSFYNEINIMAKLDHPYILKFIGYSPIDFKNQEKPIIFTELATHGSLNHLLNQERHSQAPLEYTNFKKFQIIYGIASGMLYLHQNQIIHRDLKPENILIDEDYFPRISDFGLSKIKHSQKSMTLQSSRDIKGTYFYIAPEIWASYKYDKPGDVYAFSLIAYEIITSKKPFQGYPIPKIFTNIVAKHERPEFDCSVPLSYRQLIEKCWSSDPEDRPTFEDIVKLMREDEGFIIDKNDREDIRNFIEDVDLMKSTYDPTKRVFKLKRMIKHDSEMIELIPVNNNENRKDKDRKLKHSTDNNKNDHFDEKSDSSQKVVKNNDNEFERTKQSTANKLDDESVFSFLLLTLYYFFLMFSSFIKMNSIVFIKVKNAITKRNKEMPNDEESPMQVEQTDEIDKNDTNDKKDEDLIMSESESESESISDDFEDVEVEYIAEDTPLNESNQKRIIETDTETETIRDSNSENKRVIEIDDSANQSDINTQQSSITSSNISDSNVQSNQENNSINSGAESTQSSSNYNYYCSTGNQDQAETLSASYISTANQWYEYYNHNRKYEYQIEDSYYVELYRQLMKHPPIEGRKRAVLISTGAYCPVHAGHLKLLDTASEFLSAEYNIDSILGIVSASSDFYVYQRFKNETIPVRHRFECLKLVCNEHNKENGLFIVPDFWEGSFVNFFDFYNVQNHFIKEIREMLPYEDLLVLYVCGSDLFIEAGCSESYNYVGIARPGLKIDCETNLKNNIYVCNDKKYTGFYYDSTMAISLARKHCEPISGLTYESVEKYLRDIVKWI